MKFLILLITSQIALNGASYLQQPLRCFKSDAECTTTLARVVVPALLEQVSEPISIDSIPTNAEGLKFDMKDVNVYGLKGLFIDHFSIDPVSNMTRIIFHGDLLTTSRYNCAGTMFSSPIYGDGDLVMDIKNAEIEINTQYDVIRGANGLEYARAKGYQFRYDVKGYNKFRCSNLFNGDKELSDFTHYLFDNNWKILTDMYGRTYFRAVLDRLFDATQNYLLSVPLINFIV